MRTSPARLLMAFALAAVLPRGAEAQSGRYTLEPGDTVRVAAPSLHEGVIEGELLLYQGDSLAVREASTGTAYRFPLATIQRLEKNQGTNRRRSVRHWMLGGLFVGAAAGLVSGPFIATAEEGGSIVGPTILSGLGGGVLGLGLGAAGGSAFSRDHWQRFQTPIPPAAQVSVSIPTP
jgi:protein involved in polysaccharide export with SLBB domain